MKPLHFYITLGIGALCLILSITTIVLGKGNNNLQAQLQQQQAQIQQQQAEINKGSTVNQIAQAFVRDMAPLALKNEKIKQVLAKNGLTVTPASSPAPSPSSTSTPAPSPVK